LGLWDADLAAAGSPQLIRVCREGEAIGLAVGLLLGGATPLVAIQCTGFYEAGDALRNAVHDLGLPLTLLVGVRSELARRRGSGSDNAPLFIEPIVRAWNLPYRWLDPDRAADELLESLTAWQATGSAGVLLLPE
jgi:sulfopyruvate decarboxylase TPP-binding subunit